MSLCYPAVEKEGLTMAGFPENVLIVDDDEVLLEIEELALKRAGDIAVQACATCDQAVEVAGTFTPDLVLLDLKMPGKDGTDVVREFRKMERLADVPIIFVTGEHKLVMQDEYRTLGVLGIIYKPFKPSEFIMNIQKFWQGSRFNAA